MKNIRKLIGEATKYDNMQTTQETAQETVQETTQETTPKLPQYIILRGVQQHILALLRNDAFLSMRDMANRIGSMGITRRLVRSAVAHSSMLFTGRL